MEYSKFIWILNKLRKEKVSRRAKSLCRQLMDEAKKRGISLKHISEVSRQLLDSEIVNIEELDQFKVDSISSWNKKGVGLNDDISIPNHNDIDFQN